MCVTIISKIYKILFKQSCLLCLQSSDLIICDVCMGSLVNKMNLEKHTVKLNDEYTHYYMFDYTPEMKYLLKRYKFNKDILVADVLFKLMMIWWDKLPKESLSGIDSIAVVPIHRFRYLYRGFNQSEVIAQEIADNLSIDTTFDSYKRVKYSKAQAKSSKEARTTNIDGAFTLTKEINCNHLLVFDDVYTTGSTLHEFIKTICNGSMIKKVTIITIIRA